MATSSVRAARRAPSRRRRLGRRGQTATEFMLVVSVITIATAGATYYFLGDDGPWAEGFDDFNSDMQRQIDRGYVGGEQAPG